MAAALVEADTVGVSTPDTYRERVLQAVSLVEQGNSYREAARKCSVKWGTVYAAHRAQEEAQQELNLAKDVGELVKARARVACVLGIERIIRDIDHVNERHVVPWTWTAARLAGVADAAAPNPDGVTDSVSRLLAALGSRGSLEVGIRAQRAGDEADSAPTAAPQAELVPE